MRMDLSREEETKMLPSEEVGLVSMSVSQKELIERIGCRVQPMKLKDLNNNQSKLFKSIKKALLEFRFDKVEQLLSELKSNAMIDSVEANEAVSNEYEKNELSIKERLIKFDQEVIRIVCPNTPEEHRLMRPDMLEMLLKYEPTNMVEFSEKIPRYHRKAMQALHPKHSDCQIKFIKDVVKIIDEFGER